MRCTDVNECFEQISAYFSGNNKTGHTLAGQALLVNTENYDIYQDILQRLQADDSKECIYVSELCFPNGLPDVDSCLEKIKGDGDYALVGLSQAVMLQGNVENKLREILGLSISSHVVVLLDHCERVLQKLIRQDARVPLRVVLVDGEPSQLPKIKLAKSQDECIGYEPLPDFSRLLAYLEHISENLRNLHPEITVISHFSPSLLRYAVYPVTEADGVYDALTKQYADIAGATRKEHGNDNQWNWLANQMKSCGSFSALICDAYGATVNLSSHLSNVMETACENSRWLLWLALKVFGEKNNAYLTLVLGNSDRFDNFIAHAYMDLADVKISDSNFDELYLERKHLLEQLPEQLPLIAKYCERLGIHQKDEIFYLTDRSDQEKFEFMRCLSVYEYSDAELKKAIGTMSKPLTSYMQEFIFDEVNTKLPEADSNFRGELTKYFKTYKTQKLTNRIYPDFLNLVNQYALLRPYNKLQPRSSIISHMNKEHTQLFFFDALGIEYLAFILAKCEEYGLVSEVSIGHCELPSITVKNKEFLQYFSDSDWKKIDDLDEIKHHSQIYNYEKCEYPLHLFAELDVIDVELRKIQSMLVQGTIERVLIVSDHGASRLAVRYGHESPAPIELDESGEHSGRCCPISEDPQLKFAAYEDGFSVLANYERFKGGRRANVEVHGGAALEEVMVPIIVLTKRPDNIEICFTNSVITLKPHTDPELLLYSNVPLQKPRLLIDDEFYNGEFVADKKHARFLVSKIKRKGNYTADVYDGEKKLSITLAFSAQKQTREVDFF